MLRVSESLVIIWLLFLANSLLSLFLFFSSSRCSTKGLYADRRYDYYGRCLSFSRCTFYPAFYYLVTPHV